MPADLDEVRQKLLQDDEHYRELATLHHDLDAQVHHLSVRQHLSEPEQLEETALKKRKLLLKDQMESIVRQHAVGAVPTH